MDLAEEVDDRVESRLVEEGIRAVLVAPLLSKRGAIGALCLGSGTPGLYADADAEFLTEVGRQVALAVENMLAYEEIARLKERLEEENLYLQEELKTDHTLPDIVGQSFAMRQVASAIETVAPTDASVLITGETGTGKELVARAVHNLSTRGHKSMITVNCAALPSGLIESELFGHERGAFTGAVTRKNRPVRIGRRREPFSLTRSETLRWSYRRSSCAFSRRARSNGSAPHTPSQWTSGSSRPRITRWTLPSVTAGFGRISIIG